MRRRSSAPAPGEVTTDPHTGQGASVGALPSKPGPLVRETSPPPPPPPSAHSPVRRPSPGAASRAPLHLTIFYPHAAEPIQAQDSSFLFGSVGRGRGDVALSINGFPVHVAPNGSWLAWIPLPNDSLAHFQ